MPDVAIEDIVFGVIYCRVSTKRQEIEGDGLNSQERSCREYAQYHGIEVLEVYKDAKSGFGIDRPEMQRMLKDLRKHRHEKIVVIIDDISRLARGMEAHFHLRKTIAATGAELRSPRVTFGEGADSRMIENNLANFAEYHRTKNAEQTRARRRARMLNGWWIHHAPPGYRYTDCPSGGRMLERDEPIASIIQEGLEAYASGRFQLKAEVGHFFESHPEFPKNRHGKVSHEEVNRILSRVLYAGYIESETMGITLRKGHHPALITLETHQRIEKRMSEKAYVPRRKNLDAEFPLRGFVVCSECQKPMTSCNSKGRNKHYAYYYCVTKGCDMKSVTIPRDKMEAEFVELVKSFTPSKGVVTVATRMFKDLWEHRLKMQEERQENLRAEVIKHDKQADKLVAKLIEVDSPIAIAAIEKKLQTIDKEKALMNEKIEELNQTKRGFDESLRTALRFLASPCSLWDSGDLAKRRSLLKLAFAKSLEYHPEEGFQIVKTSLPFKALAVSNDAKNELAEREGFEPSMGF